MDPNCVLRQVEEVLQTPRCPDWGAKVLFVCEHFWAALSDDQAVQRNLNPQTLPAFLQLLRGSDAFELAQQVIPDLRHADARALSRSRTIVLEQTEAQRSRYTALHLNQAYFDSEAYKHEKATFFEAAVFRAALYLQRSDRLTPEEEVAVRGWLEQCPLLARKEKGGRVEGLDGDGEGTDAEGRRRE